MSSAARFLLEFEARGDQEVVNKIKAVGTAGKETATDLQSLQGIEDPFAPIAEGADAAVTPIEGVGTAAEDAVSPIADLGSAATDTAAPIGEMGTAMDDSISIMEGAGTAATDLGDNMGAIATGSEAASGGLTDANTLVGDFGEASATSGEQAGGLAEGISSVSGSIAAIGGAIGTAVSAYFRLEDANNRLFKAQNMAARAAETYRKAEEGIDKILATATGNIDAIAAARQRLADAQGRINELQAQGITSGEEYEAALAELQEAQAGLAKEAAKGGVDVAKLTDAMEKAEIAGGKVTTTNNAVEKAQRAVNQSIMENVFAYTSLAGSAVQIVQGMNKARDAFKATATAQKEAQAAAGLAVGGFSKLSLIIGIAIAAIVLFLAVYDKIRPTIVATADAIGKASNSFGDWMLKLKELVNTIRPIEDQEKAINKELGKGTSIMEGASTATAHLGGNAASLVGDLLRSAGASEEMINEVTGIIGVSEEASGTTKQLGASAVMAANEMSNLAGSAKEVGIDVGDAAIAMNDLTTSYGQSAGQIRRVVQSVNDMSTAVGNNEEAINATRDAMVKDTNEKNLNARATLDLINSTENHNQALATVNEEWANSVDRIADLNTVMGNAEAHQKAVATAVNETTASLMEENIALDAAIRSADSANQAQLRLANAQKEGTLEIKEYINGLDETATKERAMVAELQRSGAAWSDIPPFVEKNIDTLKLFGIEAKRGGEAAAEAAKMAADAWRDATSEMGGEISSLADIIMKGGKDMDEATDKFFEDFEGKIGRNLSGAEQEAVQGLANINASAQQAINQWQFGQLMEESVAQSGDQLAASFDQIGNDLNGAISDVFHRAAEIIRSNPELAPAVNEVMQNAGKEAPNLLMQELNTLPGLMTANGQAAATAWGTGFTGNAVIDANTMVNNSGLNELPPKAGAVGNQAGIQLSEQFAAAGVHIAAVIRGITANINSLTVPLGNAGNNTITATNTMATAFNTASRAVLTLRNNINAASSGIKASLGTAGTAAASFGSKASSSFNAASKAALNARNNVNAMASSMKSALSSAQTAASRFASSFSSSMSKVKSSASSAKSGVDSLRSSINSLKSKTITITTRYRTVGSPPRSAQGGMHETLAADTVIQAHKGERVDIGPGSGSTTNIVRNIYSTPREGTISVPVFLDGKLITRIVRRHLAEDVGAGM